MGRSSGTFALPEGRSRPSPRSSARMPCTQPRHDSCAMTTVISAMVRPSPTKNRNRYLRVSSLRRATKLKSCTRTSLPIGKSPCEMGRTETSIGAAPAEMTRPGAPANWSSESHVTAAGSDGVATRAPPSVGQNPIANNRSSCVMRAKNCSSRGRLPARSRSSSGSWSVFATNVARTSRSRTNHCSVSLSTSGTTAQPSKASATSSGTTNRSDNRMGLYTPDETPVFQTGADLVDAAPYGAMTAPRVLYRTLRLFDGLAMVVGITIGSGIFRTPGLVAQLLGRPWLTFVAWILGGVIAFLGALCFAELATRHPNAGGKYVYAREAFGPRIGFVIGWCEGFAVYPAAIAALGVVTGEFIGRLVGWPPGVSKWVGVGAVAVLVAINLTGVTSGRWLQNVATAAKVLALSGVVVIAFVAGPRPRGPRSPPAPPPGAALLRPPAVPFPA